MGLSFQRERHVQLSQEELEKLHTWEVETPHQEKDEP
jgi:hypothetical protein